MKPNHCQCKVSSTISNFGYVTIFILYSHWICHWQYLQRAWFLRRRCSVLWNKVKSVYGLRAAADPMWMSEIIAPSARSSPPVDVMSWANWPYVCSRSVIIWNRIGSFYHTLSISGASKWKQICPVTLAGTVFLSLMGTKSFWQEKYLLFEERRGEQK